MMNLVPDFLTSIMCMIILLIERGLTIAKQANNIICHSGVYVGVNGLKF